MAAIANLVLANNAAVNKTFNPVQKFGGANMPARWVLKEGLNPTAWPRVEISQRRTARNSTKVSIKVVVPHVVEVNGVPTTVATAMYDESTGGYIIPETAPTALVQDLYAYVKNLHNNAVVLNWVVNADPAF